MGFAPWKFNISANKIVIYAATALEWSAFRRYSGNLASKSVVKAVSCSSLSFKISWRLAIKASIRMPSDLLKVISAISSTRKKNSSPRVRWSSFCLCSIASNIWNLRLSHFLAVRYSLFWSCRTFSLELLVCMTFSHSYPLYKLEWSKEPSHKLRFLAQPLSVLCSSPTPSHQKYDFAKLIRFLFTFWWWVGSLQFRTTLFIHTASSIPRDSSVLLSSFFTRSMVFAHIPRAQLLFALLSETFLTIRQNSLYVTVCIIARSSCRGYFIHSLSTLHYCNAPSLATRLTGDYRDRTYTG